MRLNKSSGTDLARDLDALRSQLEHLAEEVGKGGETLASRGERALRDTLRAAQELLDKYGDSAKTLVDELAKLRDRAAHTMVEQTREHPLGTLAVLIGLGFLAGYLSRRH